MATSVLEVLIAGDSSGLTKALAEGAASAETFQKGMATTGAKAQSSLSSVSTSLKALAPAFVAVGAVAVGAIVKGVSATQQWASDTRTLQRITGQSAESASGLLGAANLLGLSVSSLSTGFGILSKNIVNGSTGLTKYGIATRDAQGQTLPFDSVLGNVVDKFATLQPGAEQTAFAMNVFGRSGKDLLPILLKGRDGLAELTAKAADLGLVMSQDDVNASKRLTEAQHQLGLAFKGAEISIGELFIPALTKVVDFASKAVQVITRLPAPVKEVGLGVALAAGAVGTLTLAFQGLTKIFSPVISGIKSLGQALLDSGLLQNAASALSATASGIQSAGSAVQVANTQIQDSSQGTSTALQAVNDATSATAVALQAGAAKSAGAFTKVASTVQTGLGAAGDAVKGFTSTASGLLVPTGAAEEALAGVGTAAETAGPAIGAALVSLGPVGAIIAGVAAAVALATVVIVKNWDKVKAAFSAGATFFAPLLTGLKSAFAQVGQALGQTFSALGDLGHSLAEAFAPLAPIITPVLSILAKALGLLLAAPFVAVIYALTIGLKGLAASLQLGADLVEFFANAVVSGVNLLVKAINSVLGASNKYLHTNFGMIDTLDNLSISATSASTEVGAIAPAMDKAGASTTNLSTALNAVRPLLQAMGTSFQTLKDGAVSAFTQAQQSGADTTAALQSYADQQIAAAQKARQAFQSQAQSALTFTTSMLSALEQTAQSAQQTLAGDTSNLSNDALAKLRDQAHLTAGDILDTFRAAAAQSKQFGQDLLEISRVGGKAGKDLASSLLASQDVLSAQLVADAPAKLQAQIVGAFGTSENVVNSFASKLTDAIVGPLKGIKNLLEKIAHQGFGIDLHLNDHGAQKKGDHLQETVDHLKGPHVLHVSADDGASYKIGVIHDRASALIAAPYQVRLGITTEEARRQLQNFDTTLNTFLSQKRQLDIGVHTHPSSPWPDEALKTHLTDPIQRAGFKKINGTWTLPLSVGVHGELGPMSDLWKRQAEDAATSIVALANRSGSTPKEGVGIVRHVAQAGSDAAYIKSVAAGVGKELNAAQAQHFERALQLLDKRTMEGGARSDAAIQAALGKMSHLLDANQAATRQWMTDALNYATKNAPRLPRGHTNISVNHHERRSQEVRLDRRRFADAAEYDIAYARGF